MTRLSPAGRRALANELTRRSLKHFHEASFAMMHGGEQILPLPHLDAMTHVMEELALGRIKRLIITLPPRHGKSELISGSFPAWLLGHDPTTKVTVVSYGDKLSIPLVDKARLVVKHATYAKLFPNTKMKRGKDRQDFFEVEGGGSVRAASKDGAMTGLGTHYMIVDDFHKAGESLSPIERERAIETFQTTYLNRFDNLNDGRIVLVMQRIHEDDLVGWALRSGGWRHLNLPAIAEQDDMIPLLRGKVWYRRKGDILAPDIASAEFLEDQRRLMGARHFGAQFQQNPIIADGGIIDWNDFNQYDERPERTFFHKVVQSIDPAATDHITSDYSVGHTWGFREGNWYLLDVFRVQATYSDLFDRVVAWHRRWKADALIIEGASIGHALYDQVKKLRLPSLLRCFTPRLSKIDRLANCTVQLKSGCFYLPASADWLPAFKNELLAFPDGRNDDHVDAMTQFIEFAFKSEKWISSKTDKYGRRCETARRTRRPRSYDDDGTSDDQ